MTRRFTMLLVVMLIACGGVVSAGKVKVEYWTWDNTIADLTGAVAQDFMRLHPDIEVEVTVQPWTGGGYWDKLTTLNATGNAPDIYNMSVAYCWDYANADWTMNLDPLLRELKKEDYFWDILRDGSLRYPDRHGGLYAFPFGWVMSLLYYNKNIFDDAGQAYPHKDWDWLMARDVAKKLVRDHDGDGTPEQWGMPSHSSHEYLDSVVYGWGGAVLDAAQKQSLLDRPKSVEAIQFLVDLIHVDRVAPMPGAGPASMTTNMPMGIGISVGVHHLHVSNPGFDWDVTMVPKGPQERVIYGGPDSICISKFTKHLPETWRFFKYLISNERSAQGDLRGRAPISKKVVLSQEWREWNTPPNNIMVLFEGAPFFRGADFGTTKWMDWRVDAMNAALAPAFRGTMSVKAAAEDAVLQINNILNSTECRLCEMP